MQSLQNVTEWMDRYKKNTDVQKASKSNTCTVTVTQQRKKKFDLVYSLLFTHRSPGLNSRENLVLFFLCFLFRLRIESGMLFLRFVPRPPLWEEAVELADDVRELQGSYSQRLINILYTHTLRMFFMLHIMASKTEEVNFWYKFLQSMQQLTFIIS